MSHVIELPDNLYRAVERYAAARGETPEAAIVAWASAIAHQLAQVTAAERHLPNDGIDDPMRDPWAGFRGITTMLSPDSLENHDRYLAEEYSKHHESDE